MNELVQRAALISARMTRPPEHYQYMPLFARIAIERIDCDNDLRTGPKLDELLDAYAKTYGEQCDKHTRDSAHYISARRFWDFSETGA